MYVRLDLFNTNVIKKNYNITMKTTMARYNSLKYYAGVL